MTGQGLARRFGTWPEPCLLCGAPAVEAPRRVLFREHGPRGTRTVKRAALAPLCGAHADFVGVSFEGLDGMAKDEALRRVWALFGARFLTLAQMYDEEPGGAARRLSPDHARYLVEVAERLSKVPGAEDEVLRLQFFAANMIPCGKKGPSPAADMAGELASLLCGKVDRAALSAPPGRRFRAGALRVSNSPGPFGLDIPDAPFGLSQGRAIEVAVQCARTHGFPAVTAEAVRHQLRR